MTREPSVQDEVRQRALSAMLTDAFFTWPSAVTIGMTILAFFSGIQLWPGMQPWMWVIIGAVLEVVYIVATLTDPAARKQALDRMLTERFDPRDIKNDHARSRLEKALEYKRSVDTFVSKQAGAMRVTLDDTRRSIDQWIGLIYRLAKSIDNFESNAIIDRDRREVPTQLRALENRLKIEKDPAVRAEIQQAIEIRSALAKDLEKVESLVKRTEIKMDTTVAQLSTVHARMQLMDAKELDSGRAQRLQTEIKDELSELNDIVDAMDDVYSSAGYTAALSNLQADSDDSAEDEDLSGSEAQARRSANRQG